MLARAARRHSKLRLSQAAAASYQQLHLPWLCPAVASCAGQDQGIHISAHSSSTRRLKRGERSRSPQPHATRRLATAVDRGPPIYGHSDDHIPFEGLSPTQHSHQEPQPQYELSNLRPLDADNVVMLPVGHATDPPHFRKAKLSSISGDTADLQQNLYACIKVGRLDRAAALVRRLVFTHQPDSAEVRDAHHQYLAGLLEAFLSSPSHHGFVGIQKWFELDVRGRDVPPSSAMIAILVKAAFRILDGTKLERTIRRYLNVAQQIHPGAEYDTLASSIFTDAEWVKLLRMFPDRFPNEDMELLEEDIESIQIQSGQSAISSPAPIVASKPPLAQDKESVEIRPVEQKGLGLKALKRSLSSIYEDINQKYPTLLEQQKQSLYKEQERLEQDVLDSALEKWREDALNPQYDRTQSILTSPKLGSHVHKWISEMTELVKSEIQKAEEEERLEGVKSDEADRVLLSPFLKLVSPEKLSAAAVLGYISAVNNIKQPDASKEVTTASMVSSIGFPVAQEIQLESAKKTNVDSFHGLPSSERRQRIAIMTKSMRLSQTRTAVSSTNDDVTSGNPVELQITNMIKSKLGAMFLSMIIKTAKLPVVREDPRTGKETTHVQPVVSHGIKWRDGKRIGVIKTNEELVKRLKKEPVASFIAKHLPMIVEPQSWDNLQSSPYLKTAVSPVRYKDSSRSQRAYVAAAAGRGDMKQVFAGLDVIGKIPWRINGPVFKVLTEAWNTGEAIGGLAPENPVMEFPPKPVDTTDWKAYRRWKTVVKNIENEYTGYHSERCYQNFQLEVARAYLDKTFYCPHNVDFRGRAYPIPPYFNHMGADYVRGLFLFADGKQLGETGLRWLKIHVANVFGYDKESLDTREAFTMDHLADIYDSATNPLRGQRWWLSAGDPWQCLAACIELKKALDSPVPSKFVSHLPIHQDGTCNGLQHYAALGGDVVGARQVNLLPGERPADIYSAVAEMVKADISKLAANGDKEAQLLDGKITRKVVKQPVMTNVYGVTQYGANQQVRKQLVDIMPKESLDNDIHLGHLSRKIAIHIFKALAQMFTGAHAIQEWLGECGARISQIVTPEQVERIKGTRADLVQAGTGASAKSKHSGKKAKLRRKTIPTQEEKWAKDDYQFKSTIVWTTPLGMPVVQPYRKRSLRTIKTNLQSIKISEDRLSDPVHQRRQLQAFPPNFIHSLDATHMLLSALKCNEIGLTFSAVHDSFWTHAADVPIMNRVLRDAFVRMHGEDIVGRLREEFMVRYRGCLHYAPVSYSSPTAKKILALRKEKGVKVKSFWQKTITSEEQVDELLEEYERLHLLQSDDPADRERGEQMVTPGSLLEQEPDQFLVSPLEDGDGHEVDDVQAEAEGGGQLRDDERDSLIEDSTDADSITKQNDIEFAGEGTDHSKSESQPVGSKGTGDKQPKDRQLYLWMPIHFPHPPQRGDFNVTKLKDSQYFFS